MCPVCGKNPVKFLSSSRGYKKHCSCKCSNSDPETKSKIKETCLENWGVESSNQSEIVKEKKRQTWIKNLGVDNPFKNENVREKYKQRSIEKYNTEHPSQNKSVRDKFTKTMNELYQVSHALQHDIFKEQAKQTCYLNHGVTNPFHSQEIRNKATLSCLENWGVDNYAKSSEYHKKAHKPYTNPKYPDMTFARSWEFKVYDFLTEHNIPFEYQPSISIPYECEGTHHTYHPDFLVGDKLVEVKGDNFFRINEETGKEEMYLTWQGDLSDEEYEWKCKVMEAKHQCMLANNVVILRGNEIKNLSVQMFI